MTQTGIEFAKDANQRDLTSFSERCITVFLPATFSHWVPTPELETDSGDKPADLIEPDNKELLEIFGLAVND